MPEEKHIWTIQVEGKQAKDALERILEAIQKTETAIVGMGEKFDVAIGKIAQPINRLTTAVDALNASIGGMQRNLGDTSGLQAQSQAAQQATVDLRHLRQTIEQYRAPAFGKEMYKVPGGLPGGGQIASREQMIGRYMAGQFGPTPTPAAPTMGPTMLQYEETAKLAKNLGLSMDELGAHVERGTASFAHQGQTLREGLGILEATGAQLKQLGQAEEQLTASTGRAIAEQLKQREGWEQMVASGERVAVQLRQQTTELTRRAGAMVAARQRGGAPGVIGQVYRRAGLPTTPRLEEAPPPAVGDWEKELEQIQGLEAAIGRKIVVQKLMARGAQDVAEKFEKQFAVTRSKEEILREVSRTGKMTTEMERELGLQTERTGQQARRAGGMMRYFGRYLLRYLILWQGIQAVRGISKAWFAAHMEMADAVADFGWRVSATTEDVARYRDKLRDVSMLVGMPVGQITSPLAGQATEAELLRAAEASKVFGGSVEDWLRTLEKGDVTLDAFAHGLRISTLATEDYAKLVGNASDVAKEFNVTQAEAIGLLSSLPAVLRTDAEGAAELTEALAGLYEQNQLLMTMGVGPAVTVGPGGAPQRRPIPKVMAGIGRLPIAQQRQLAAAIGLTSEAQQQLFLDAVAGWAEVQQAIQSTVDATGDFVDALAGADESLKAHVESMKTAWSGLLESFGTIDALKDVVDVITMSFEGWGMMIEWVGDQFEGLEEKAGWLYAIGQGPFGWLRRGIGAAAELYRGGREEAGAAARAGAAGAPPGPPGAPEPGPGAAYFPPMPTMRMQAGMTIGQLSAEMERVIDEVFTRPYTTASGEVIQVTKEQIDVLRKNTVILDETGEAIGLLNVYAPALSVATENLKTEVAKFNLERLRDIEPEQFDLAMRTILPTWEARLAAIPGFEEEKELQTFFVGEQDVLRQQLATQTAMSYTLQDILDVEKDQLEGMWNIPSGVTMRVPLTSMDLMRWMKGSAAGGVPTDMMPEGGPLEAAATAQGNAAMAMHASANAQTVAAQVMTAQKQVSLETYMTWAEAERLEYAAREPSELKQQINRRAIAGGGGKVVPTTPVGTTGIGALAPLSAQFVINLVSTLFLDKKVVAESVQTELARQLVNTSRGQAGGGASLRP